jgi:hypothetical protein
LADRHLENFDLQAANRTKAITETQVGVRVLWIENALRL